MRLRLRNLLTLSLLLWGHSLYAQGARYDGVVQGSKGTIAGATIAVCTQPAVTSTTPCSPLASIFSNIGLSTPLANPTVSDVNGNYHFYIAPGTYTIQIYGAQISTPYVLADQSIGVNIGTALNATNLIGPGSVTGNYTISGSNTFSANNTFTGNNTHSGAETFKCFNASAICFADQFSGADASIKVNACIAAAIALGGGTCDARALVGAQTISQQINVGNPVGSGNTPVVLLLPPYGIWTPTGITDGVSYAIKVWTNSSVIGTGATVSSGFLTIGGPMANTINMGALCGTDTTETSNYIRMEGFKCGITSGTATMAKAVAVFYSMPGGGTVHAMGFYNLTSTNATKVLWVYGGNDSNYDNLSVDAFNVAGVTPCWFGNGATIGNSAIRVTGADCVHPGSGASAVRDEEYANFNGNGFTNIYIEENRTGGVPDLTTPTVAVVPFSTVLSADLFIDITMQGDIASSTRYTADIASGAKAIFYGLHQGGVSTNAINDHNGSGTTITAANYTTIGAYSTEATYLPNVKTILTPNLLISSVPPTFNSGFNAGAISSTNGPASFVIQVGTGTAGSTGVVNLPAAANGWTCPSPVNLNRAAYIQQTTSGTTSVTFTNYGTTIGTPVNWTNSDFIAISCFAR